MNWALGTDVFPLLPFCDRPKMLKMIGLIEFKFSNTYSFSITSWSCLSRSQATLLYFRSTIQSKNDGFWFLRLDLDTPKAPKHDTNFNISLHSNSLFSITFALTSSIKVLVHILLPLDKYLYLNFVVFRTSNRLFMKAANVDKRNCYCSFVNSQTRYSLKLFYDKTMLAEVVRFQDKSVTIELYKIIKWKSRGSKSC